jgi:hypothetical protein
MRSAEFSDVLRREAGLAENGDERVRTRNRTERHVPTVKITECARRDSNP